MQSDKSNLLDLTRRVALVTGAGQGIGSAIAQRLAAHGARVIVNDFFQERAEETAERIIAAGGTALPVRGDVTSTDDVRAMLTRAKKEWGAVEILINNAGNAGPLTPEDLEAASKEPPRPFWEMSPEHWARYVNVNFYGVVTCVSLCVPDMIALRRGRIITIISDAGRVGEAGLEVYSGAKAGAAGFMRAAARSLGRHFITANCISIAATMTPALEHFLGQDEARLKKWLSQYVIRRPGQPADVANMALFLASDGADWITGQTYPVNGGFSFGL